MSETLQELTGRMLDIASGRSGLPLEKVAAYRVKFAELGFQLPAWDEGSGPLPAETVRRTPKVKPCGGCGKRRGTRPAPAGFGPGSELLKAYAAAGMPHCQACFDLAAKMDAWGIDGCRGKVDEIVEDILPRAKTWLSDNKPWVHALLAGVGAEDVAIRFRIKRDVVAAIEKAAVHAHGNGRVVRARPLTAARHWASAFAPAPGIPRFITNEQFAADTLSLLSKLPPEITSVAGIARSGLYPATMIAMMLHLPLKVIRQGQADWLEAGNGWRLHEGAPKQAGVTLVVDDTVMTGNSMRQTREVLANMPGDKLYAAVYVNPAARTKPDLWAVDLPWPHLLQWNVFNSVLMDSCAFDFDGVLCHDCPPQDDDDGDRYEAFLRDAKPRHLVRKRRIKLIVTARLEKYRPQTLTWLEKWGVKADQLIMGPWGSLRERRRDDVAAFKARHVKQWLKSRTHIRPKMYIESDPRQAKRIATLSGGLVVCPNGQCFRGMEQQ